MLSKAKEKNIISEKVKKTSTKKSNTKLSSEKSNNKNKTLNSKIVVSSGEKSTTSKSNSRAKNIDKKSSVAKKSSTTEMTSKNNKIAVDNTSKRTAPKRRTKKAKNEVVPIAEYYDLPYKYGNTLIRLLAQTPTTLFVYWEVSDADIANFKRIYGDDFFFKTKPILIVHNQTLNKHYEVEINDFANCWYLNTDDSDCVFDVELARRLIPNSYQSQTYLNETNTAAFEDGLNNASLHENAKNLKSIPEYINIAKSNDLQSPNDHILFEKLNEFVVFRNVRNGDVIRRNIKSFKFLKDIYRFYKEMYNEEIEKNPSSQFKF